VSSPELGHPSGSPNPVARGRIGQANDGVRGLHQPERPLKTRSCAGREHETVRATSGRRREERLPPLPRSDRSRRSNRAGGQATATPSQLVFRPGSVPRKLWAKARKLGGVLGPRWLSTRRTVKQQVRGVGQQADRPDSAQSAPSWLRRACFLRSRSSASSSMRRGGNSPIRARAVSRICGSSFWR